MDRGKSFLRLQAIGLLVFGIVAIVVALVIPPKGQSVGVLPLVVGIVFLAASLITFAIAARRIPR